MEHKYKGFALQKSDGEKDAGTISGYFSTYDRIPDSYGDIIAPGAFAETIEKRESSGHPFPLCWNHDLDRIIGKVDSIEDTDKGPLMTASFFDTPLAQEKREIVKSGVVFQFSFAYDVLDEGPIELENGVKANELRKLDLYEVSIVPIPANQNAVMTEIKSDETEEKSDEPEVKSGRRNSAKDEGAIRDAISALEDGISALRLLLENAEAEDSAKDQLKDNAEIEAKDQQVDNALKQRLLETINKIEKEVNK